MSTPKWWNVKDFTPYKTLFNEHFFYDETSPTCLKWRIKPVNTRSKRGDVAGGILKGECYQVTLHGEKYRIHHVIWIMHGGTIYKPTLVNHIDGDKTNNKRSNLRLITQAALNLEREGTGLSSTRGVYFDKNKNKWAVEVYINKKKRFIGRFDTEAEALFALNQFWGKQSRILHPAIVSR